MRGFLRAVAPILLACLLAGCDPPGKPKEHEPQAENREQIMDFNTLFASNCSGCHGAQGKFGGARILNDAFYLAYAGKDNIRQVIRNGRPGTAMPAWAKERGGPLTDQQVEALVNGIFDNWAKGPVPGSLPAYAATAPGDANHGRKLFVMDCFMCHGKGARVGMVTDPQYVALVSNQYLRSAIVAGRKDLGMPTYKYLSRSGALSDSDINDLVAFVASYRPANALTALPNDSGTGQNGDMTKGNEGSGNGPGNPRPQERNEGNKSNGSSSQQGVK